MKPRPLGDVPTASSMGGHASFDETGQQWFQLLACRLATRVMGVTPSVNSRILRRMVGVPINSTIVAATSSRRERRQSAPMPARYTLVVSNRRYTGASFLVSTVRKDFS